MKPCLPFVLHGGILVGISCLIHVFYGLIISNYTLQPISSLLEWDETIPRIGTRWALIGLDWSLCPRQNDPLPVSHFVYKMGTKVPDPKPS